MPGQRVIFCATATITLQYVSGDGQQVAAGQLLAHPLEVRVCNGQRSVPGTAVHFAVTQGGGTLGATPVTTDANGIATIGWQLGSAGPQRVEAELRDSGGARVQHVGFNADIEAPPVQGSGGCAITIGKNGQIERLTPDEFKRLLEESEGRLCLCFLAGDHVIEGLQADGGNRARVSIHGCGPAAVIRLQGRNQLNAFAYFEVSDLAIDAEQGAGFEFIKSSEVVLRNLTVAGADASEQPLLLFFAVEAVTIEGCSVRPKFPGLSLVIFSETMTGPTRLVNNEIAAVTSFYGMPNVGRPVDPFRILERMARDNVQLEPVGGEVVLANNRFELLTVGAEKMDELDQFAEGGTDRLGLCAAATLSGNSIGHPQSTFLSMLLSLGTTLLLMKEPENNVLSTFVANSAAVAGTATLLPEGDNAMLVVATRKDRCREQANLVFVLHN